ncbi:hypothetical protein AVEN_170111-1 [Araneus ventricosus]|uniref:Uncharacterized protein n=1 Tax=Araneus ventricosus TaxID=182803 RepID=A0A4Y2WNC9_ARAVE|nr:hypothetical protein AVEN_170111-1 [Araneus ventricosus]
MFTVQHSQSVEQQDNSIKSLNPARGEFQYQKTEAFLLGNSRRVTTPKFGPSIVNKEMNHFLRKIHCGAQNRPSPASVEWGGLRREEASANCYKEFYCSNVSCP